MRLFTLTVSIAPSELNLRCLFDVIRVYSGHTHASQGPDIPEGNLGNARYLRCRLLKVLETKVPLRQIWLRSPPRTSLITSESYRLLGDARDAQGELHHCGLGGLTTSRDPIVDARQAAPLIV